jgi:large subunit ribosomal protein L13
MNNKTFSAKDADIERAWWHIDLAQQKLGRAASEIATLLRGKHKPSFTPHVDCGDFVVCTNADQIILSGNKLEEKMYRRHSQYPGGLNEISAEELMEEAPEKILEFAVRGMLPKNQLGEKLLKKLKVYAGDDHPHGAQEPETRQLEG